MKSLIMAHLQTKREDFLKIQEVVCINQPKI